MGKHTLDTLLTDDDGTIGRSMTSDREMNTNIYSYISIGQ